MRIINSYILFENLQQAKSILRANEIPENNKNFLIIKDLLKDNLGYIGWFTKMFFEFGIGLNDLKELYRIISTESEIITGLSKPVISYSDWEALMDDIIKSQNKISVKRVVNEFPQLQKSFINLSNSTEVSLLSKLSKFKDKENFYKKISRYKTKKELIDAIKLFTTDERKVGYTNIKNAIVKSKAKIVYDSHFDDIIICEVDFSQLRQLASDTSWCILSESTFKSYANGIDKQYIIFLTDKTGNMSKIGITYGLRFRTAHAINDSYVDQSTISKLLDDRGASIDILKRSIKDVLNDSGRASVSNLIKIGISKENVLKYKENYTEYDLKEFSKEEIEKYQLRDKLEIRERDFYNLKMDFDFLQKNKHRFVDKVPLDALLGVSPSPSQFEELVKDDIVDKECIEFLDLLKRNKHTFLHHLKAQKFDATKALGGGYIQEWFSIRCLTYGFKYNGISDFTNDLVDIIDSIPARKIELEEEYFVEFIKYLENNGFKLNSYIITELVLKFSFYKYSEGINVWLSIYEKLPIIKDFIKEILLKLIDSQTSENYTFLRKNNVDYNLLKIDSKSDKIIKKDFKDIFIKMTNKINIQKAWKNMRDVLPDPVYQGNGIGRKETQSYMKSKGRENAVITPQQVYDDFYEILKNEYWKSASNHGTDMLPTLYMIFTLVKLGKYEDIGKLDISWSDEFTGKIIGQAMDMYKHNGKSYVYDNFLPNESEQEKLFTYLLANIKEKVYYRVSNVKVDIDMIRHKVFSLIYYLYDWGFNKYFDLVSKTKNVYKEKWDKVGETSYVEYEACRIDYFKHIFDYLSRKKEIDKIKELIDKIMQWKMTKEELAITESRLSYTGRDDISKQIRDYIFPKYFPVANRKRYERNNHW